MELEFELLKELYALQVTIKNQRKEREELQNRNFPYYIDTLCYSPRYMEGNDYFYQWSLRQSKVVAQISRVNKRVQKMEIEINNTEKRIRNIREEIQTIQEKYKLSKYFDTDRLKKGMKVEYDYTGGLNSSGVDYILVKVTKTYVEGYPVIGNECGLVRKITKPKQLVLLYTHSWKWEEDDK